MASDVTRSQQSAVNAVVPAALTKETGARRADSSSAAGSSLSAASPSAASSPPAAPRKATGYGLPCSKCHLYYAADLEACPTCKHNQRVSPVAPIRPVHVSQAAVDPIPDTAAVEQEREAFLRQFKSQLIEAHAEVVNAPASVCKFAEQHSGEPATAEICQACYERLQERLDVFEGALHMELKEAAQIIYDAVWADPSDPNKTYQNAASALLTELRKRAGMTAVLGPL
ncbi:MAG TPA: hypothetical protein VKF84_03910 [Candidatus Sulfotelmatobacter sp.]|nr:hypothetical protein [Candidatus Sulfotelmatobacter sp.]